MFLIVVSQLNPYIIYSTSKLPHTCNSSGTSSSSIIIPGHLIVDFWRNLGNFHSEYHFEHFTEANLTSNSFINISQPMNSALPQKSSLTAFIFLLNSITNHSYSYVLTLPFDLFVFKCNILCFLNREHFFKNGN